MPFLRTGTYQIGGHMRFLLQWKKVIMHQRAPCILISKSIKPVVAFWTGSGLSWGLHSAAHRCYIRIQTRTRRHEKEMCASIHLSFKMEALQSERMQLLCSHAICTPAERTPYLLHLVFKLRISAQNKRGQTPEREILRTVWGLIRPFRHLLRWNKTILILYATRHSCIFLPSNYWIFLWTP